MTCIPYLTTGHTPFRAVPMLILSIGTEITSIGIGQLQVQAYNKSYFTLVQSIDLFFDMQYMMILLT